jgi:hypothetical protein
MTLSEASPYLSAAALVIVAASSLWNNWQNGNDAADTKLVALLKDTVAALEMKVKASDARLVEVEKKLTETLVRLTQIQTERDNLAAVLQGRDAASVEMMKTSLLAIQNVNETAPLIREMYMLLKKA